MTRATAGPAAVPRTHVEHCMGTVFSVRVAAPGVDRAALQATVDGLHAVDAMFSTYRPDSEISRIDAGELAIADGSPQVRDVLAACEQFRVETDGYFDARAVGPLDPSGYVKGWAIRRAADQLAAAGSANHCVNGGGDVQCVGRPASGRPWAIGVSDSLRPGELLTVVRAVGPVGVATSGPAERGAHIVDPHTGAPARGLASVTVVADDLVRADVYATAAVAMGADRAPDWLASRPGVRALLVTTSGRSRWVGS